MNEPPPALPGARARTWATVDLDAVAHNLRIVAGGLPAGAAVMAVVKADAYGHGAVPVAEAAVGAGAGWLGVATHEEALELREAGLEVPLLVMGPVPAAAVGPLAASGCTLTVGDRSSLTAAAHARAGAPVRVHLKIDTGMTRLGILPEELPEVLNAVDTARVAVDGVFTHLACADDPDDAMTRAQTETFVRAAGLVRDRFPKAMCHVGASATAIAHPESVFDMVRVGIALYGAAPAPHLEAHADLRAVMTLSSRVVRARRVLRGTAVSYGATYRAPADTAIATVAVGYGDGYPRSLSGSGVMVAAGRRCPVAGRVCMDYTMLDVGDAPVREGDEVVAFGPQLPAVEVAEAAGTIAYELFCRVSRRVPRIYLRGGRPVAVLAGDRLGRPIDAGAEGAGVSR
jgi:alanine racemase